MTDASGMKQADLKPCCICRQGMAHNNSIHFYRMTVSAMVLNVDAVRRQHGLEVMMGPDGGALAAALGLNEDMATPIDTVDLLVCSDCAMLERVPLAQLMEDGE